MFRILLKVWQTYLLIFLYGFVLLWWLGMQLVYEPSTTQTYYFNFVYGLLAAVGFTAAFLIAHSVWGGWRSMMGKMLLLISAGLFLEWLGICWWLYFNLKGIDAPYPSVADFGYFGLIPMYIVASFMLARATGIKFNLSTIRAKAIVVLVPLIALGTAFLLFVKDVGYQNSSALKVFFDVAYPIGEIIPVTIAVIVLALATKRLSGGIMKARVLLLILAFFAQFLAEYVFLYQFGTDTYVNAGTADLLYATSYFIMGLSILGFARIE
jgi:hypothetical protein